jgi:hypothetical protein
VDIGGLDDSISIVVGEHELTVKGAGYETITKVFKITRGKNSPLTVTLLPSKSEPEWTSLFNGRDLRAWNAVGYEGWRVRDGTLVAEATNWRGWLMSDREYGDFELDLEYKLWPKGSSGVFLRAWRDGHISGKDFHEVQLLDDDAIEFATVAVNAKNGALWGKIAATPRVAAPALFWNQLRIAVRGNLVQVSVNGVQVVDGELPRGKPNAGRLSLQLSEQGVAFRSIRVRELFEPSAAEAKPPIAPDDAREFGGHRYKFYPQRRRWKEARDRCQSLGGHLVIVDSLAENAFVADVVQKSNWQDAWIGATDEAEEGKWRNVGGELIGFTNWMPGQPNNKSDGEHYALMTNRSERGEWCDQPNESQQQFRPGFVCEWEAKSASARPAELKEPGEQAGAAAKSSASHAAPRAADVPAPTAKRFACQLDKRDRNDWSIDGDELVQNSVKRSPSLVFGDQKWGDYDFSVEFKKMAGNGVFALGIGHGSANESFFYRLGLFAKARHDVGYDRAGKHFNLGFRKASLDQGRWYGALVRVRGNRCECFLDGEKLFAFTADGAIKGPMSLSSKNALYRFRNIVIKAPDGAVLLEGLPDLEHSLGAKHQLGVEAFLRAVVSYPQ